MTVDWRAKNLAKVSLEEFQIAQQPSQGLAIWADGAASAPFSLARRYDLPEADILVIWSAPCGWRELVYAIERVKPATIYLCAAAEADDRVEAFLKRLTGLLKHDITQRGGRVNLPRLAAALNQRLITARKGIEWLEAAGQISVRDWSEEHMTVELGGQIADEADELASELKVLLAETAAWRQYYRRLKVALEAAGLKPELAEVTMRAENTIALAGEDAQRMQKLLDVIEDLDDVQDVFHNAEMES